MDANILQALAALLRQRQGAQPAPQQAPQDPMFAIRQLVGGGVLGQGLAQQRQALDSAGQDQPAPQQQPTTLGALGAGAAPAQRPTFYRPDDPSTFSPEQLAQYMAARGIQKPNMASDLNALVARLLGRGAQR